MEIELLRSFVTLANEGGFSPAAKVLYISQPALSRRIKSLEGELGCSLIKRSSPLELTIEGKILLDDIDQIVSLFDSLDEKAKRLSVSSCGAIKVQDNSHSPLFLGALASHEATFSKENPGIPLSHLECPYNYSFERALREGVLDVCFEFLLEKKGTSADVPSIDGIAVQEFRGLETHLCLALKPGVLSRRSTPPSLNDFIDIPLIASRIRYLEGFRKALTDVFLQETGNAPKFDYRTVNTRSYLYASDPHESALVLGHSNDIAINDGIVPPAIMQGLESVEFNDYIFRIYCLYREDSSEDILRFVEELNRPL